MTCENDDELGAPGSRVCSAGAVVALGPAREEITHGEQDGGLGDLQR